MAKSKVTSFLTLLSIPHSSFIIYPGGRLFKTTAVAECAGKRKLKPDAPTFIRASRILTVPGTSSLFESHTANMSAGFPDTAFTEVFRIWVSA